MELVSPTSCSIRPNGGGAVIGNCRSRKPQQQHSRFSCSMSITSAKAETRSAIYLSSQAFFLTYHNLQKIKKNKNKNKKLIKQLRIKPQPFTTTHYNTAVATTADVGHPAGAGSTETLSSASAQLKNFSGDNVRRFDWKSAWYPVAIAANLDKRLPHAATIMGHDLVLWWDRSGGSWQVFKDACPHRLAPLSEGRISEEGHLQCSYHGWKFCPSNGSCSFIPQAEADGPKVHNSKRACATPYPSMEQQGLVWFWPDSKVEARSKAANETPLYLAELDDPCFSHQWVMRDMPFGYEVLIENLMDPSHVPFAHHKLQGNRNKAKPLKLTVEKIGPSGFEGTQERGNVSFIAPCFFMYGASLSKSGSKNMQPKASEEVPVKYSVEKTKSKQVLLIFWCLPVSPGRSRLIWNFPRNFALWLDFVVPTWLNHLQRMLVLDSDMYLLHKMEKQILKAGTWETACYVPTSADRFVIAFRSWLRLFGGQPEWESKMMDNTLPTTTSKEQLMGRYESHVKHCPSCMTALSCLRGAELLLQALSIASVAVLAVASVKAIATINALSIQVGCFAVFCCVASRIISNFIQKNYFFHDYIHALVK